MSTRFAFSFRRIFAAMTAVTLLGLATSAPAPRDETAVAPLPPVAVSAESSDWKTEIDRSLTRREYDATDAGSGLQAPNRAHALRTYFDSEGARIVDRFDGTKQLAGLRTVGIGRASRTQGVPPGTVDSNGARVEVRRTEFVEWFENSQEGLEHGWTLAEPPAGDGEVSIEVAFDVAVRVDGDRATLDVEGRRLEYAGLEAWDARGVVLPGRMEAAGDDRVRIVVDDAAAEYPITIDPMLTQPAFATLESNQALASLGYSVDGAGDVNGDGFDDVIVGAPTYDSGQTDEGAAFIFHGGPAGIASAGPATAATTLESNQEAAQLGLSVSKAGDVNGDGFADVLVGTHTYDSGEADEGAAFLYLGGPTGIPSGNPTTANGVLESNQILAFFGISVACAGDVNADGFDDVLIGADGYDAGQVDEGAAFVFLGGPAGIGNGNPATASTVLDSDQVGCLFGYSTSTAGDTNGDGFDDLIVGAYRYASLQSEEGAAFVFLGSPAGVPSGNPASAAAVIQSDQVSALLGISVASAGDTNNDGYGDIVVGAQQYDSGHPDEGAAFVFLGSAIGISSGNPTTAGAVIQSDQVNAGLGFSVDGAGDINGDGYADVVVGSGFFNAGQVGEGIALVFLGGVGGVATGTPVTSGAVLQIDQASARFGVSVSGTGDVNNDGFDDVIVGAPFHDAGQNDEGAAFVYLGSQDGIAGHPTASAVIQSNQMSALFGFSVAGAGDVNSDGYADVIVGSLLYDLGQTDEGAAFIFHGGPGGIANGIPTMASTVLQSDQSSSFFGVAVAGAGDVNGDGFDDVIVGANEFTAGQSDEGTAFVFLGGPSGVLSGNPLSANATLESDQFFAHFGSVVAGAGDVNGDGFDDIVVGAELFDMGQDNEGAAFVFHGSVGGITSGNAASADTMAQSNQANALFGRSASGAGDVNGDGFDDIVVGATLFDSGALLNAGAVFVYAGSAGGVSSSAATVLIGAQNDSLFGFSVASAGDVNADGFADIVVGAEHFTAGQINEGGAFVFHGSPIGIPSGGIAQAAATIQSDQTGAAFGHSVSSAGDVNLDGFADVVIGSGYGSPAHATAFVYLGSAIGVSNGSPTSAAATLATTGNPLMDFSTATVAGAGDTDGDGFPEILVGSDSFSIGQSSEGAALIFHLQRPPAAVAGSDTVGIYVGSSGAWFLRNSNAAGSADLVFGYGPAGLGWTPLAGDWDGDGDDTPGLYDPATGNFFLRNDSSPGPADSVFGFGPGGLGWLPLVGDWDGDGDSTVGLYAPSTGDFFLRNTNAPGPADLVFSFGPGGLGWIPVVGDWDGAGGTTVGVYDPAFGFFFLRNTNAPGAADLVFGFGPGGAGWQPIAGDYDGNGTTTVGLYAPLSGFYFLRQQNLPGPADMVFGYGPPNVTPLVGDWDGM